MVFFCNSKFDAQLKKTANCTTKKYAHKRASSGAFIIYFGREKICILKLHGADNINNQGCLKLYNFVADKFNRNLMGRYIYKDLYIDFSDSYDSKYTNKLHLVQGVGKYFICARGWRKLVDGPLKSGFSCLISNILPQNCKTNNFSKQMKGVIARQVQTRVIT